MNDICKICKCCSTIWEDCSQCDDGYYESWEFSEVELHRCGLCDGTGGSYVCVGGYEHHQEIQKSISQGGSK